MSFRLPIRLAKPCVGRSFSANHRAYATVRTLPPVTLKGEVYQRLEPPPYPYGEARWYKQSNKGLYGGLTIRYGNNVSKKTKTKTRRVWKPNIVRKRLYSVALGQHLQLRVAVRVLRTIDKVGGLDEYVLGDKPARIKELGPMGWRLRWVIMQTPSIRMRMAQQAKNLGIDLDTRKTRGWLTLEEAKQQGYSLEQMAQDGLMSKKEIRTYLLENASATSEAEFEIEDVDSDGASADAETATETAELSPTSGKAQKPPGEHVVKKDIERLEQLRTIKPVVLKLHNLEGRRGRRSKKWDITVLQKQAAAVQVADPVYEEIKTAYLQSRQKDLVARAFPGQIDPEVLGPLHEDVNTNYRAAEPSMDEAPPPPPEQKGIFARAFGRFRKEHSR